MSINSNSQFIPTEALVTPIKCTGCGDAQLMGMQPAGNGLEQRTFECAACEQQTTINVSV